MAAVLWVSLPPFDSSAPTSVGSTPGATHVPTGAPSGDTGATPLSSSPEPTQQPQPSDTVGPPATQAPSPDGEPATPAADVTDEERSDAYWNTVTHFGIYGQTYGTLEQIVSDVHLVVRGRVVDIRHGDFRPFQEGSVGSSELILGIVAVDEVLKGDPIMREPGFIEVAELGWSGISLAELPTDEAIFFLKNDVQQRQELGYPPRDPDNEQYRYWRPNGYQCVLRITDGRLRAIGPWESWQEITGDRFPGIVHDEPADVVMTTIRDIVRATSP